MKKIIFLSFISSLSLLTANDVISSEPIESKYSIPCVEPILESNFGSQGEYDYYLKYINSYKNCMSNYMNEKNKRLDDLEKESLELTKEINNLAETWNDFGKKLEAQQ